MATKKVKKVKKVKKTAKVAAPKLKVKIPAAVNKVCGIATKLSDVKELPDNLTAQRDRLVKSINGFAERIHQSYVHAVKNAERAKAKAKRDLEKARNAKRVTAERAKRDAKRAAAKAKRDAAKAKRAEARKLKTVGKIAVLKAQIAKLEETC